MFPMRPYHSILHDYIDQMFEEKTGFDDRAINDVFFKADDTRLENTCCIIICAAAIKAASPNGEKCA